MHRSRGITRNAPYATRRKTKSKRVVGTIHQKTADPRSEFSDEEWQDMVATAAYFRAEARGFEGGSAEDDWYEAEAELRERLSAGDSSVEADSGSGGDATNIETKGE
jgi:hypothetical protein